MKNIKKIIFTIFSIFIVTACANVSVKEDLQENNWNFIQDDGVAGKVDFSNDKVVASIDNFPATQTHDYKLNDDETEIVMSHTEVEPLSEKEEKIDLTYSIEKIEGEYILTLISDSSGEKAAGYKITLTPREENDSSNS